MSAREASFSAFCLSFDFSAEAASRSVSRSHSFEARRFACPRGDRYHYVGANCHGGVARPGRRVLRAGLCQGAQAIKLLGVLTEVDLLQRAGPGLGVCDCLSQGAKARRGRRALQ